jgi:hypothetical protein
MNSMRASPPRVRHLAWGLAALLVAPPALAGQATDPVSPARPDSSVASSSGSDIAITAADLDRVRKALESSPTLNLGQDKLRYYVRILAKQQTFADFLQGYDFKNGPTRRGNPMSHQEFLAMVTPKEMNSSGGITAMETLQFAFTNWLGQSLVRKALEDLRNAKSDREVQEIRDRIERELAALRPPDPGN